MKKKLPLLQLFLFAIVEESPNHQLTANTELRKDRERGVWKISKKTKTEGEGNTEQNRVNELSKYKYKKRPIVIIAFTVQWAVHGVKKRKPPMKNIGK